MMAWLFIIRLMGIQTISVAISQFFNPIEFYGIIIKEERKNMNPIIVKQRIINTINEMSNPSLEQLYNIIYSFKIEIDQSGYLQKEHQAPIGKQDCNAYQKLRMKILNEQPELAKKSKQQIKENFEAISHKVASNMPYKTVDEFIKAMRREDNF